jgi:hypothetical protein
MANLTPETKRMLILCVTLITIICIGVMKQEAIAVVTAAFTGLFGIINSSDK